MSEKTNLLRPFIVSISLLLLAFVRAYPQSPATFKLLEIESIDIDGKEYVLKKGEMEISEDRTKAISRTLSLPILIIRAHNSNGAEPIFWLDGGPGASNILSTDKIASASPSKLLENHDFVCVGYRGVDGSTVLKSKKINQSMKGIGNQMLSDRSLDNLERKITEYSIQLRKNGIDISRYSIIDVIEDIEEVRKSLGYGSINLLSVSFGTRIALLYGYKYPEIIKRSLMIGACPPGYFLTREEQAENTLAFYDSLFSSQANAEYKGSIQEAMKKTFTGMPKGWATFRLDPEKIKAGTVSALYSSGSSVWAFNCYFKAAQENDYSGLYMLQKIYEMNNRAVIGDVYGKTVSADMAVQSDNQLSRESLRSSKTILGNNISVLYGSTAHAWAISSIPDEFKKCTFSGFETLVISGDLDFRTPAGITNRELMPFLSNGKHIVLKNMAHTDIPKNTMKSQYFFNQYFDSGKVEESLIPSLASIDFEAIDTLGKVKIFLAGLIL